MHAGAIAILEPGSKLLGILSAADLALILLLLAGVVIGFWSGFVWQLVCILALVVTTWFTLAYHPVVAGLFGTKLSEPVRLMISAAAVFVGGLLVCYLLGFLIRDMVNAMKPRMADRVLGAAFGLFNAALLIGALAFVVLQYADKDGGVYSLVESSKGASLMAACLEQALPRGVRRRIKAVRDLSRDSRPPEIRRAAAAPGTRRADSRGNWAPT
ncbi:MAG: CvpA family protein [Planctomycetota bacterium]|jgi:membrane protein required for colicin V production